MITPPLKWHGGKHYLAPKIIELMPPHLHYVEPYFGGGAVLLAKDPEGVSEVVNDINQNLINFWNVLRVDSDFQSLKRALEATPFSEELFKVPAYTALSGLSPSVWCAWIFFIQCRQSMAGRMRNFTPLTRTRTRGGMNAEANAWIGAVDGLPEVHVRLRRVVILNNLALNAIKQQDGKDTLFYLDPPYLKDTRTAPEVYEHEMSEIEHLELLEAANECKGKVMLSGYESPMYANALRTDKWTRYAFPMANHSGCGETKQSRIEVLWCNFRPSR